MNIRASRPVVRAFPRALTATVAVLLLPMVSFAANKTWDGGGADNNWLTGGNWDLDTAPASNDALFFAGSTRLTPTNNFAAGSLFNGITFNAGAGAFMLSGNSLTLTQGISSGGGNTTGGNITNNSTSNETINLAITLGAGNHAISTGASSGALNIAGPVTRSIGSQAVFTKGGGNINLTGSGFSVDASGILGGWAVTNIGTSTGDWATLDGSGNVVAYTAYTDVAPGAVLASSTTQNIRITTSGANVTTAGNTEANTILYTGTTANQTLAINAGTTLRLGAKGAIMNAAGSTPSAHHIFTIGATAGTGFLTAGGADNQPGELFLYNNSFAGTNNDLTINSVITDNGGGAVTVNVMGYVVLATSNSYSGNTYINQGRIQASNANAFGTGSVNVAAGAEAFLNNNGTYNNNFFIVGIGATETSGGQQLGAIRMNTGGTTIAGTITLLGDSRISGGSGGNNVITGRITGTGRLEFTAATGNNGSINLNNTSASPNDWTGGLIITVGGGTRQVFLKLLANEQIPDGAGKGDVTIAGTSDIARFDLNGRSETINGLISATGTNHQVANLGSAGPSTLTLGNNNATATFGGVLSDAGGANTLAITKIGSGTQTLAGTSTNLGLTSINAGTLAVTGSLATAGTVSVNANGTTAGTLSGTGSVGNVILSANSGSTMARLAPGANSVAGNIGTLTMASLTVNGGDYVVDITGTNDAIIVTGTANFTAASTITPSSAAPNGVYTVLTAGTLLGTLPTVVQPTDTRKTFALDASTPNALNVVVDGFSKTLNWTGATNNAWDLNTTINWNDGVVNEKYFNGDAVNFMDGPANRNVTITGATLSPAAVSVTNSAGNDYSISGTGAIGGGASLTKDGTGTLTLNTNNTYTGATTIFAGTLQVGSGGTTGSLGSGGVNNNGVLIFNRSDNATVANAISGTGSITKSSNGVLTLSGVSSYSGPTAINTGTVKVTNSNSLGAQPGGTVTIASGATLDLGGNPTANNQNFLQKPFVVSGTGVGGSGAIVNNSALSQQNAFQRVTLAADASFGGPGRFDIRATAVSGVNQASLDLAGHTLTKDGAFFFSLVGVDVSDGDIVVNAGTLNVESTTAIPDFGTGRKITYKAGVNAQFFATVAPTTVLRPMVFDGGGIQIGNSSNNTASTVGSPMLLNGDVTLTALSATPGLLTLSGNITETGGARAITKTGNCTILLTGNNSFSGGTTVTLGTLQVGSATALGASSAPVTVNGGTLDLFGNNLTVGSFSGTGGTITSSAAASDLMLTVGGSGTTTFAGVIQNGAASSVGLTKQSNSNLILSGISTYSGDTVINAGTLTVNGTLNASTVKVNGGTLKGTGTIITALHLDSGTLAPGASPGILNTGSVDFNGGTFAAEIGGNTAGNGTNFYDQLNVTGFVTFTAPVALTLDFSTYDPIDNVDAFTIINNDDLDDVTFFGVNPRLFYNGLQLNEGTQFTAVSGPFTQTFTISYIGGTGNDVVLLALPEPASAAILLCGFGVLAARRSRRSHLDTPALVKGSSGREMPV